MIDVFNVEVNKTTTDRHQIAWSARRSSTSPSESVDDYNFKILWSFDPVNDFEPITDKNNQVVVIDGALGPFLVEHYIKHTPHNREHYYKVQAINKTTPSTYYDSKTYYDGDRSDGVIKTIVYAERLLNNNYIGEPVYLLKRKTDGGRCPQCWNPYKFQRTKTHCPSCRGTGFFDGFYLPIETQVSFEKNPKIAEMAQTGEIDYTAVRARISHFPLVTPRDMIISKDSNTRFTITKVDYTKLPNLSGGRNSHSGDAYIVSQMLFLSELPPDDDKYNVVIGNQDIRSFFDTSSMNIKRRNNNGSGQIMKQYCKIYGQE